MDSKTLVVGLAIGQFLQLEYQRFVEFAALWHVFDKNT